MFQQHRWNSSPPLLVYLAAMVSSWGFISVKGPEGQRMSFTWAAASWASGDRHERGSPRT